MKKQNKPIKKKRPIIHNDVTNEQEKNRLKEALLVAKVIGQQKKKKQKILRYDARFIFKLKGLTKKAFRDYTRNKHTTGAKILRDYINRLLGEAGQS